MYTLVGGTFLYCTQGTWGCIFNIHSFSSPKLNWEFTLTLFHTAGVGGQAVEQSLSKEIQFSTQTRVLSEYLYLSGECMNSGMGNVK